MTWRSHPAVRTGSQLGLGERAADRVRNGMGSWRFIWIQTGIIVVWVALNAAAWALSWDPYPWILLNLVFSTQAAYASPIILLSQKRADQNAAELAQHDYDTDQEALRLLRAIAATLDIETGRGEV